MSRLDDQNYLRNEQYLDASRLNTRINLHARFSVNPQSWFQWMFDHFEFPEPARILELGCGVGDLWRENQARLSTDWEIVLSDFSPGMLDAAQANLAGLAHPVRFEVIDAQSIPYPQANFDAVIASLMLYHVPDVRRALAEIQRVLKPGGYLYAATVGKQHLQGLPELVLEFDPDIHLQSFDEIKSFDLERGQQLLQAYFGQVDVYIFEDALRVTEAAPLVDYMLSGFRWGVGESRRQDFKAFVQRKLDSGDGVLNIKKDLGMLVAR